MTDARSPMRALRAAVFAAVCVTLAAAGHSFTSGHEIPFDALWTAFGVTGVGAWLAGGRRRGVRAIGAALLTVQGALHLIFAGKLPYGLSSPPHGPHGDGATGMRMDPAMNMDAGTGADPAVPVAVLDGPAGMIAAHLLAAAVCALWLARGEAALFRLARAAGAPAFIPLRPPLTAVRLPAPPEPVRTGPASPAPHRTAGVVLAHTLSRRGPPAPRTSRATAPEAAVTTTV
ncbi:hypothetical protein [Streptomyces sp. AK02-01A]|uniref:hypothetical protein n=1 Tax=Streptomyces sp. AK02-01A TaxID=3028648 RepID=UPI0029BB4AB4|nr:hypothetical protein [Streptomyces sp. AK02-01A]MDX3849515.1 hypothetical protein [Streptomyces sp. AK02-01A]MDX3849915.1 hypothetical protein [Streptomyces sp. AK02-01A]